MEHFRVWIQTNCIFEGSGIPGCLSSGERACLAGAREYHRVVRPGPSSEQGASRGLEACAGLVFQCCNMTEARGRAQREDTPRSAPHIGLPLSRCGAAGGEGGRTQGARVPGSLVTFGCAGKGPPPPLALRTVVPAHGAERRPRPSRYGADLQEVNV